MKDLSLREDHGVFWFALALSLALHVLILKFPLSADYALDKFIPKDFFLELGSFDTLGEPDRPIDLDNIRQESGFLKDGLPSAYVRVTDAASYLAGHPKEFMEALKAVVKKLSEEEFLSEDKDGDIFETVDTEQKLIDQYKKMCAQKITRHVWYPNMAHVSGYQGQVVLALSVDTAGALLSYAVFLHSDYSILDAAALDAVAKAVPFDPFPEGLSLKKLSFYMTITYDLESINEYGGMSDALR